MLIKCRECGGKISNEAKVCPRCGVHIPDETEYQLNKKVGEFEKKRQVGCVIVVLAFLFLMFVVVSLDLEELSGIGLLLIVSGFIILIWPNPNRLSKKKETEKNSSGQFGGHPPEVDR